MGALGRVRRKIEGAEAQEIGRRQFALAIERAASKRGMTLEQYCDLAVLCAMEADGIVHLEQRGTKLEVCFAPDQCAGHG